MPGIGDISSMRYHVPIAYFCTSGVLHVLAIDSHTSVVHQASIQGSVGFTVAARTNQTLGLTWSRLRTRLLLPNYTQLCLQVSYARYGDRSTSRAAAAYRDGMA